MQSSQSSDVDRHEGLNSCARVFESLQGFPAPVLKLFWWEGKPVILSHALTLPHSEDRRGRSRI